MEDLKGALGTDVQMTVYRKLQELSYHTSYSHGSRYYTLDSIAQFDEQGLWSCRSVWFSRYGTLLATLEAFVAQSEAGYFAHELRECPPDLRRGHRVRKETGITCIKFLK